MWYPQWGHQGMMNTMAGSWNVYAQDFVPVWPLGSNSMSMGDGMNPGDSLGQMAWGMHPAMMNQWASGVEEGMPCKDVWQRSPGLMPPLDGRTENKICGIDNATQAVGELQVAKEVAALWNLAEDYTEESLRNDLAAIDFEPIVIRKLNEADGVWYFVFHEEYEGGDAGKEGFEAHTVAPHFGVWEEFAGKDPFTKPPIVEFFRTLE